MANSCPNCGRPMQATTIEQTAKRYKLSQLVGGIVFVVGITASFLPYEDEGHKSLWFASFGIFGLCIYAYGRIGAWWKHG